MANFRKKKAVFSEKDFNKVKQLLELGLNRKQVVGITGWSYSTILYAAQSDTYPEYRKGTSERLKTLKGQKAQTPVVEIPNARWAKTTQVESDFHFKVLNDNLVLFNENMKKFTDAQKALEIAIYSLRKSLTSEDNKKKWF